LPGEIRERIYQNLYGVLTNKDKRPKFAHLSPQDRRANPGNSARYKAESAVLLKNFALPRMLRKQPLSMPGLS
jgi:hypothetical protein